MMLSAILTFALSKVGRWAITILAVITALSFVYFKGRHDAKEQSRVTILEKTIKAENVRKKINDRIIETTDDDLCRRLTGRMCNDSAE